MAISVLLHAHTLGTALELKHIRNGAELAPIAANWAYDFDYQQSTPLSPLVRMLPGDELQMDCFYDSTRADAITYGGQATTQEMCHVYELAEEAGYLTGSGVADYVYELGGEPLELAAAGLTVQNGDEDAAAQGHRHHRRLARGRRLRDSPRLSS